MPFTFSDLIDSDHVQALADANYRASGVPIGIVDRDGSILVAAGWQEICTGFHRVHPETCRRCHESDRHIADHLRDLPHGDFMEYRCGNGMWDIAIPIIVEGEHLASCFLGQFFYEGEQPDRTFFRQQAKRFGFDESAYLAALDRVPVFSHERVQAIVEYDIQLVNLIVSMGLSRLRQREELARRLAAEEERDRFFNLSEDLFVIAGSDGYFKRVNPSWEKVIGRDAAEMTGTPYERLIHPEDVEATRVEVERQLGTGQPTLNFQNRFRHKDGSYRWLEWSAVAGPDGRLYAVARDVTEQLRVQEALRHSLRQLEEHKSTLEMAQKMAGIGSWSYDIASGQPYWSEAMFAVFGCDPAAGVPHYSRHPEFIHTDDWEMFDQAVQACVAGTAYDLVIRVIFPDGSIHHVHTQGQPKYSENGDIVALFGTSQDITAGKRVEERIDAERERLFDALESLPAFVYLQAADHTVPYANRMFRELFGALDGRRCYQMIQNREHPCDVCPTFKVFETGSAQQWEWERDDGRVFAVYDYPFQDTDGSPLVLEFGLDVSEIKRSQRALAEAKEKLELQVACVSRIQGLFITDTNPNEVFDALLLEVLGLTRSAYGFIADVEREVDGVEYLHTLAISNIAWDEASRHFYATHAPSGFRFPTMRGLYAAPFLSGEPVFSDDPAHDPRRCGLPDGHPPLHAFLGLPLKMAGETIGVIGLANRPGGYDQAVVEYLKPVLASCSQLITGYRNRTNRLNAERAMQASEALLKKENLFSEAMILGIPGLFYLLDDRLRLIRWNDNFESISGYRRDELTGKHLLEFIPPGWHDWIMEKVQAVFASGYASTESIFLTKTGQEIPFLFTGSRFEADGRAHLVGSGIDISDRVSKEAELADSELKNRMIVQAARVAVWDWDLVSDMTTWTEELTTLFGHACGAVENSKQWWLRHIHPEDFPRIERSLGAYIETGGGTWQEEYRFKRADGRWATVIDWGVIIGGGSGQAIRMVGALMDITERKQAEEARARLFTIIESARDFIGIADMTGKVVYINPSGRQMLELGRNDDLGQRRISDFHPPESGKLMLETGIPTALRVGSWEGETEFLTRDGRRIPVSQVVVPHRMDDGQISHVSTIARDITEHKRDKLALLQARDAADRANRAKSIFLATMSHEIRTPLNAILGMGELLKESELTESQEWYVRTLNRSGEALLSLINDILDLSKIESGELTLERTRFDLHQLIVDTVEIFVFSALEKGIKIDHTLDRGLPRWVWGDPTRLRQVVMNLTGNAVKFTAKGSVTIHAGSGSDGRVFLTVADTGPGIDREKHEEIFKPFVQADSSTTRHHGGTGLGLTICNRLAGLMNGEIRLESEPGRGSRFTCVIPLPAADDDAMTDRREATEGSDRSARNRESERSRTGLNILLVDDAEENRFVVQSFLRKTPHQVSTAENGAVAVDMFKRERFDLVFMDIQMPVMDGYAATREIRAWESETHAKPTPIIALTAHAMDEETRRIKASGCDMHLTKPIRKQRLLEVIARFSGPVPAPALDGNYSKQVQKTS